MLQRKTKEDAMPSAHLAPTSLTPTRSRPAVEQTVVDPVASPITIELVASIIAVVNDEPMIRVVHDGDTIRLPSARYQPETDTSLDDSLRSGVTVETGLHLGFIEQIQTLAVPSRHREDATCAVAGGSNSTVSIAYLALAHSADVDPADLTGWISWYAFFPWEDWRRGKPSVLTKVIEPQLRTWATQADLANTTPLEFGRNERLRMAFGFDGAGWDEEKVLERYDILVSAGLLNSGSPLHAIASTKPRSGSDGTLNQRHGSQTLSAEHRRSVAGAISRLRGKIKSRPVVFELMPERFTLFELQRAVEAILGPHLHKQNFRRLVEHMGLVEPTDEMKSHTGGRPAKLFRFRQSVLWERLQPGVRVRGARV